MRADDPRHGSSAGYRAHWRAGQKACAPCRAAQTAAAKASKAARKDIEPEDVALTGGSWKPGRGGVLRWVPDAPAIAEKVRPRVCECGAQLPGRKWRCDPCRAEVQRATKRDHMRRRRAQEAA